MVGAMLAAESIDQPGIAGPPVGAFAFENCTHAPALTTEIVKRALATLQFSPGERAFDDSHPSIDIPAIVADRVASVERNPKTSGSSEQSSTRSFDQATPAGQHDLCIRFFGQLDVDCADKVLGQLSAQLRPGGRLILADWGPVQRSPLLMTIDSIVGAAFPEQIPALRSVREGRARLDLLPTLQRAGLRLVERRNHIAHLQIDSTASFVDGLLVPGGPFSHIQRSMAPDEWNLRTSWVADHVDALLGNLPRCLTCTCEVIVAQK